MSNSEVGSISKAFLSTTGFRGTPVENHWSNTSKNHLTIKNNNFCKDVTGRTEKTGLFHVSHFALGRLSRKLDFSTTRQISQNTLFKKATKTTLKISWSKKLRRNRRIEKNNPLYLRVSWHAYMPTPQFLF